MVEKKKHLMILIQCFYGLYPADNFLFRVELELFIKLLVPHAFACRLLVSFVNNLIIFRSGRMK